MIKAFKYKLYANKRNRHLRQDINLAAEIYNHCIALHKRYYRRYDKYLNKYRLQKHLTRLKGRLKYKHWNRLNSQAIQDITDRIHKGYENFFRWARTKQGTKVSPPTFKKRRKYKSFTLKQTGYKVLSENKVKLGKRTYKYHQTKVRIGKDSSGKNIYEPRGVRGNVKTVTIKRNILGEMFICFSCEVENESKERVMTGKIAGFDFGLYDFLTSHENKIEKSPRFYKQVIPKIKKANKSLSTKKKGSNNRKRAREHLARIHQKISNKRLDDHFKRSRKLSLTYDHLFFETLDLEGMRKQYGRAINDLGFAQYLKIQEYMCNKLSSGFGKIDRWFPSSKNCSSCDTVNKELTLKDQTWTCKQCKTFHLRNQNAGINILRVGASTFGLEHLLDDLQLEVLRPRKGRSSFDLRIPRL